MNTAFAAVHAYLTPLRFGRGDVIVRSGPAADSDSLVLITSGLIEVRLRTTPCALPELIGLIEPGQVVGEMGLFNAEERLGLCIAASPGTGLAMSKRAFQDLVQGEPGLACQFILAITPLMIHYTRESTRKLTCTAQICRALEGEIGCIQADNQQLAAQYLAAIDAMRETLRGTS